MDRRELLKMIAVITGGTVVGGSLLTACNADKVDYVFDENEIAFLNEVGETILPATNTPGAKAANVGQFMSVYVRDCYDDNNQKIFHEGMQHINKACRKMHGHSFMEATPQQRHELLVALDKEAKDHQEKKATFDKEQAEEEERAMAQGVKDFRKQEMPVHYFTLMKQLVLWSFFTSKEGLTQVLRFVPVPGRYEGCVDYKKGDRIMVGLDG